MKILAIETATEACSAALYTDGTITTKYEIAPRRHAELILLMVDQLLSESALVLTQLDAIAFGRGPGAFTGVRIATAVVQGLAFATDRPVLPISTLAALAQGNISKSRQIACAIDARMGEIYWALYRADDKDIMRLLGEESVCPADAVNPSIPPSPSGQPDWFGVGSGWGPYSTQLQAKMGNTLTDFSIDSYPSAEAVCRLAVDAYQQNKGIDVDKAIPVYLRDKVTQQARPQDN